MIRYRQYFNITMIQYISNTDYILARIQCISAPSDVGDHAKLPVLSPTGPKSHIFLDGLQHI